MGFGQSITTCFTKYLRFAGRAQRSEFWYWILFYVILEFVAGILDVVLGTNRAYSTGQYIDGVAVTYSVGYLQTIVLIILFLPTVSVAVRRLHDTGKSGWWWWLGVICCFIGSIVLFIFYLLDSEPGTNRYGPNPKGIEPLPPNYPQQYPPGV